MHLRPLIVHALIEHSIHLATLLYGHEATEKNKIPPYIAKYWNFEKAILICLIPSSLIKDSKSNIHCRNFSELSLKMRTDIVIPFPTVGIDGQETS